MPQNSKDIFKQSPLAILKTNCTIILSFNPKLSDIRYLITLVMYSPGCHQQPDWT